MGYGREARRFKVRDDAVAWVRASLRGRRRRVIPQ